jgi:hypothetical protein
MKRNRIPANDSVLLARLLKKLPERYRGRTACFRANTTRTLNYKASATGPSTLAGVSRGLVQILTLFFVKSSAGRSFKVRSYSNVLTGRGSLKIYGVFNSKNKIL